MDKGISSITITQFDYIIRNSSDEELDLQGHVHQFSEFDQEGNLLREVRYNSRGEFEEMVEYGYDPRGAMVREAYYPEENEMAEEKVYERNEAGQIVRSLKNYQDGSVDTTTYTYDQENRLVQKTTVNDEGEVEQVEKFEWENDTLVGHEVTDETGESTPVPQETAPDPDRSRTIRNEQGQVVREEELDENGEVIMSVNRTYSAEGRADEVEVFIDGRGRSISRHYFLKYAYTFFD